MTPAEQTEWDYIYNERLALLGCFYGKPPPALEEIARREADEAVKRMAEGNQPNLL